MYDIHNHLLPKIDDGSISFDDSILALQEAEKLGIKGIILTPHYIKGSNFACNNKQKEELLKELIEQVKENNINIELYLGNEIYYENNIDELIKNNEAMTLNNSKYILFELPMTSIVNNLKEVIFSLRSKGFIPIIAHPERYSFFQDKPEELIPLIKQGCLFQGNIGSLVGIYGKNSKKCLKKLLLHNLIHFMASDVHHSKSKNYLLLNDGIKELKSIVGEEKTNELTCKNPLKIINNEDIDIKDPKEFKKLFHLF